MNLKKYFLYYTPSLFLLAVACKNAAPLSSDQAALLASLSNWILTDNYQRAGNAWNMSEASGTNDDGIVFVVGNTGASKDSASLLIRRSTDEGSTWSDVDLYSYASGFETDATGFTALTNGKLYVSAFGKDSTGVAHWLLRESLDDGLSWSTIDDYVYESGFDTVANAVVKDKDNNLYVAGYAKDSAGKYHWIVRKSSDAAHWTLVDDYLGESLEGAQARGFGINHCGVIYVAGMGATAYLRVSYDNGNTWSTDEAYEYATGKACFFFNGSNSIVFDDNNNGYYLVTCHGPDAEGGALHGVVRKLANPENDGWQTVGDFGNWTHVGPLMADKMGNIYFGGRVYDNASNASVRVSFDQGHTWNLVDKFQLLPGYDAQMNTLVQLPSGTIVGAAFAWDNGGVHWITRTLQTSMTPLTPNYHCH